MIDIRDLTIPFWEDYLTEVPICRELINNFDQIKSEIVEYLKTPQALYDYPQYNIGSSPLYQHHWKAVPLSNFDGEFISIHTSEQEKMYLNYVVKQTKSSCPTINSIISDLESKGILANAFISELIPGSIINPHRGWTDKYMRIHLGVICDPRCKITVGKDTKTWEEGKLLAFKDGGFLTHSVKHKGESKRIILSIDVLLDYLKQYVNKC
jgi:aspartyl/asparaginyl beta-hydroxylase (cupin superfamily)